MRPAAAPGRRLPGPRALAAAVPAEVPAELRANIAHVGRVPPCRASGKRAVQPVQNRHLPRGGCPAVGGARCRATSLISCPTSDTNRLAGCSPQQCVDLERVEVVHHLGRPGRCAPASRPARGPPRGPGTGALFPGPQLGAVLGRRCCRGPRRQWQCCAAVASPIALCVAEPPPRRRSDIIGSSSVWREVSARASAERMRTAR
mmetsp:Transcript_2552/g.9862  ORF Transcript_2552/g.9862 Transcript_2552/m.9862 type:complete len:203 (-) Transcript_2552:369-977(-)